MAKLIIALDHDEVESQNELDTEFATIKLLMPSVTHVVYACGDTDVALHITPPCSCNQSRTFNLQ